MTTMSRTQSKGNENSILKVRALTVIGMLSAISMVLMMFKIPLGFAPNFYTIDLSEVPVLIGAFTLGPLAGVIIELIKNLLNLAINGTMTAGIGEIANFLIGCALVIPSALIYKRRQTKKSAIVGLVVGTIALIVIGCVLNAYVLLPVYGKAFNMPMEALVGMGTALNPAIDSLTSFVLLAVAPFNLIKGVLVSIITILLYKRLSPIIKGHK
ncbi:MAG: putative rane protein [Herbinix sp.]|nr:putative rane protein [Herbinix sp.]